MIFIVGKIARDFREYLDEYNLAYGLFADTGAVTRPSITLALDFTNTTTLLGSLHKLQPTPKVTAVIVTGYEHYVAPAAIIADFYGVPSIPFESAQAATDKIIMRKKFADYNPIITPEFAEVTQWDDIAAFLAHHNFPVMLKPANLMKSLYITKNHTTEELQKNYQHMLAELPTVYKRYNQPEPRIIIEECMNGSMHTVAGFVDSHGTVQLLDDVVDCVTARDIGKHDNYLFNRRLPSMLDTVATDALKEVTRQGVAALGLKNTPIHAELMITNEGPKLIEIGARVGGYRPRMYGFSRGLDLYRATIDLALGKKPSLAPTRSQACDVIELFAEYEGIFDEVIHAKDISTLASYQYMRINVTPGMATGRAAAGFRTPLTVILGHKDPAQVARDSAWILEHVHIQLKT